MRGMAMKDPRVPPMTLWGRRSGGFLKEPVYWCRKECMLWDVGGRPFLMKGSRERNREKKSKKKRGLIRPAVPNTRGVAHGVFGTGLHRKNK